MEGSVLEVSPEERRQLVKGGGQGVGWESPTLAHSVFWIISVSLLRSWITHYVINVYLYIQLCIAYQSIRNNTQRASCKIWNGMESWNGIVEWNGIGFWNGMWNVNFKSVMSKYLIFPIVLLFQCPTVLFYSSVSLLSVLKAPCANWHSFLIAYSLSEMNVFWVVRIFTVLLHCNSNHIVT